MKLIKMEDVRKENDYDFWVNRPKVKIAEKERQ